MAVKNCKFCDREGVLIYPVRYAVACPRGAAGVPGLSGNFRIEGAPQQIGPAKYTLRTIRSGYLYTYDESRRRLKAYMVTDMGYLWNFQPAYVPPSPDLLIFKCTDKDEIALARCIDIKHSPTDPATNLWIGWSNSLWTQALVKKIGDAAWRKKHMQCIYIPAMVAGKALHTAEFAANYKKIAHFACDEAAMKTAFAFSNVPIKNEWRQHTLGPVMAETMSEQAHHFKGFIVALNDPVGITNDLSELTLPTIDTGFNEEMYRGKIIADLLQETEQRIRAEARSDVVIAEQMAKDAEDNSEGDVYNGWRTSWKIIKAGGPKKYEEMKKREQEKYGDELNGRQEAAADQAWDETTHINGKPILDVKRLHSFNSEYEAALIDFESVFVRLAEAHVSWLRSQQLANWMEGVHDTADICSGYAYSESMAQCIGKATVTKQCQGALISWLQKGNLEDVRNLYARALMFNQDEIVAAAKTNVRTSDVQLEALISIHEQALGRLDENVAAKMIDRLALTTGNILMYALRGAVLSSMHWISKVHLSMLGGVSIRVSNLTERQIVDWIMAEARSQGVVFSSNERQMNISARRAARNILRNMTGSRRNFAIEIRARRLIEEGLISQDALRLVEIPGVDATKRWLGSNVPRVFKLGVLTSIVQLIAFDFALGEKINADEFGKSQADVIAILAGCTLGSTIVEMIAETTRLSHIHPMSAFLRRHWAIPDKALMKTGQLAKLTGITAGVITGMIDIFKNSEDARKDKNHALSALYMISGSISIVASLILIFEIELLWPIFILSVLVGIAIAIVNSAALQTWISHCFFCIKPEDKFESLAAEMKSFNNAVGG